jgi:hypothetical protein
MGRWFTACAMALALAAAAGCTSIKVKVDPVTGSQVVQRRTFAWTSDVDPKQAAATPVITQARGDVEQSLIAKGYAQAATKEQADFLVEVLVGVALDDTAGTVASDKLLIEQAWDAGGTGMGSSFSQRMTSSTTVINARLALVASNPADKAPLWRGVASLQVGVDAPREENARKAREATEKLMAQFPPAKAAN